MAEQLELKQKAFLKWHENKITDCGLYTSEKDWEGTFTNFFHFNRFTAKTRNHTEKFTIFLKLGICIIALGFFKFYLYHASDFNHALLMGGATAAFGILFVVLYFVSQVNYVLLEIDDNTQQTFIIVNKATQKEVDNFIETFFKRRDAYYEEINGTA